MKVLTKIPMSMTMNLLKRVVPFKLRRGLAALGVAGAMAGACKKEEPAKEPTLVLEIKFDKYSTEKIMPDAINDVINQYGEKNIKNIYLVPEGSWTNISSQGISGMRKNGFEPVFNISKKIWGKGEFEFRAGVPSQVPQDSLWIVQHGWKIKSVER